MKKFIIITVLSFALFIISCNPEPIDIENGYAKSSAVSTNSNLVLLVKSDTYQEGNQEVVVTKQETKTPVVLTKSVSSNFSKSQFIPL